MSNQAELFPAVPSFEDEPRQRIRALRADLRKLSLQIPRERRKLDRAREALGDSLWEPLHSSKDTSGRANRVADIEARIVALERALADTERALRAAWEL